MWHRHRINWALAGCVGLSTLSFGSAAMTITSDDVAVAVAGILVGLPLSLMLGLVARRGPGGVFARWGFWLPIALFTLGFFMPANSRVREPGRRAQAINNLKTIALALLSYESEHGRFPPAVVRDPAGRPLYSWRVLILPYMEQAGLSKRFHLDEPWDGPRNRLLLDPAPGAFRGVSTRGAMTSTTPFLAYVGEGSAFDDPAGLPLVGPDNNASFGDGIGRTLLVVEADRAVPWSKPEDLPFGPPGSTLSLPGGAGYRRDRGTWGERPIDGGLGLFGDGRVRFLSRRTVDQATLRALITRNGGEPLDPDDL